MDEKDGAGKEMVKTLGRAGWGWEALESAQDPRRKAR